MRCFQNQVLQNIIEGPLIIINKDLHKELKVMFLIDRIQKIREKYKKTMEKLKLSKFRQRNHSKIRCVSIEMQYSAA